nr:hypothetical protein GCM10020185_72970 [Pseudomonas brassicacearum subsp. brassicacearum]
MTLQRFSASEQWPSSQVYNARIKSFVLQIVREGRELGEFERKTPLDETVDAIHLALRPFVNPLLLQYSLDYVEVAPHAHLQPDLAQPHALSCG